MSDKYIYISIINVAIFKAFIILSGYLLVAFDLFLWGFFLLKIYSFSFCFNSINKLKKNIYSSGNWSHYIKRHMSSKEQVIIIGTHMDIKVVVGKVNEINNLHYFIFELTFASIIFFFIYSLSSFIFHYLN